jgi:ABC-2 type transport system ATP-binding protein
MILKRKNDGCIIFLTTHNMHEAEKLCDRLVLLNDGHIVEEGAPQELCLRYDHQKRIQVVMKDGRTRDYSFDEKSGEEIGRIIGSGNVLTIHSKEPTLETVFMELTGRRLEV